ncbi:MAG: hypothetical protein FD180_2698 [Planctomycetota bacterium]|nr:MAG: hypothetical protein FD180_2698 [Planctomycetota bacterium]
MGHLKRTVPLWIAFIFGVGLIIQYFVPHPISQKALGMTQKWLVIVVFVALLLGLGSLLQSHLRKIKAQSAGWGYSVVTLTVLALTVAAGFHPNNDKPGGPLLWAYTNAYSPMSSTMFSLLGFFIASAAFRAFRARSLEATLLLCTAVIVMLGQVPLGAYIPGVSNISAWILGVPLTAAKRALTFGVALGSIATALRIIFGIERSYLGGSE